MQYVNARSYIVESMWPDWCMIDALKGGTRWMRLAGQAYLPKFPQEEADAYKARLASSFLYNGLAYTIESMSGLPFSEPMKQNDDIPTSIRDMLPDVDLEGRNLHVFAHDVFEAGLSYGLSYILVDYPTTEGAQTQADVQAMNARPFMVHIRPHQVLGWKAERINGVMKLTEVRIWEIIEEQNGLLSSLPVTRVKVWRPDEWEVWEPDLDTANEKKDATWRITSSGTNTLGKIPLVPFYAKRTGFMVARPPMLDIAHLNVEHWQSSSDQRNILHTARVPILAIIGGEDGKDLAIGAASAVRLPMNSDMKYVETAGHAIAAGRQDLIDIEDRMRSLGAKMLQEGAKNGRMTATDASIANQKEQSILGNMAQNLEDAIDQALQLMADWIGEPSGGSVTVYQDFGVNEVVGTTEQTLTTAATTGLISQRTWYDEMKRRGTISPDLTYEAEQERLAAQPPLISSGPMPGARAPLDSPSDNPKPTAGD
ncbi:hypothetical protein WI89_00845 [Burkholderia ubonensis]|uniref:DUF4055 domain-containing protein n=1 Tax=Burkholderia ubonensis TaxID=101571 RepID=UPI000755340B|nr:DUF4055 domain-containing protein [Burkholderia ubonensis]KVD71801.1 hypothetical protein WI89_00845 [Burkholderia ubonensis]